MSSGKIVGPPLIEYETHENYVQWWKDTYVLNSDWWPPAPPTRDIILRLMREEAQTTVERAPILEPQTMIRSTKPHLELAKTVLGLGGSSSQARAAVRHEIERSYSSNRTNEICAEGPTSLSTQPGSAGIGFKSAVLNDRKLADQAIWDKIGKSSKYIQFFSWNAGNLGRPAQNDLLNDLIASPFHIACLQEAREAVHQRLRYEQRGIRSVQSRDLVSMINAGGSGLKIIRKCHDEDSKHCDMVHRPFYYAHEGTSKDMQCIWHLVADVAAFDGDLIPLNRGGQFMWRVCTVHMDCRHAHKKEGLRASLTDFFMLMMRDRVDVVTGDFNQSHGVLGEILTETVKMFESAHGQKVHWRIPGQETEIRSIMFNWPVHTDCEFLGPEEQLEMQIKDTKKFDEYDAVDFGLKYTDADSHNPSLFIIRKSIKLSHMDKHQRSSEGKKRDAERRRKSGRTRRSAHNQKVELIQLNAKHSTPPFGHMDFSTITDVAIQSDHS